MQQHIKNQFKYCPYCGKFDSFIFDTKLFKCSNCSRTYFINPSSACGAIIDTPDGIVAVRRKYEPKKDMLGLPGGFIDLYEKGEDAIKREVYEEISYIATDLKFLGTETNDYIFDGVLYITLDLYFYTVLDKMPELKANDDAKEIVMLDKNNIDFSLFAFDTARNILKRYLSR